MKLKGIDGTPHKRWIMLFNSKIPEKPYQVLTCFCKMIVISWRLPETQVVHGCRQLVSWDVRLSPKTSETLIVSCQHVMVGTLTRLPMINWRKVRITSNQHAPYDLGYKRDTMAVTKGSWNASSWPIPKNSPSPDWSLQLDFMKLESLVIANQHVAVNTFSGFVHTARQTTKVGNTPKR